MRKLVAALAFLALAACGQSSTTAPEAGSSLPAWRVALGDSPQVLRTYAPDGGLAAITGSATEATGDGGVKVTTGPTAGQWAAMVTLGDDARPVARPTALRIHAKVETGALYFVSTYDQAPAAYQPVQETVQAGGPAEIYLPIDANGPPLLIVANASEIGKSVGSVQSIELLAGPAARP
ncbi:MAG: hypothetical protein JNJ73_11610 [Hyphomonadaceae bacterium]|nr:hypothetical protein [Hyphomonadaceae bacterium]